MICTYKFVGSGGAAAAVNTRNNSNHDQRQPKEIIIESYSNNQIENLTEHKGILPCGSRETTPSATDTAAQLTDYVDDKGFFSGNPFVEVTKGIIHIYKRK